MAPRSKYRPSHSPPGTRRTLLWLGAVAVLALLAWFWWAAAHPGVPSPRHPAALRANAPSNAPAPGAANTVARSDRAPGPPRPPPSTVEPVSTTGVPEPGPNASSMPAAAASPQEAFPRPARSTLEAQVALNRLGISSGSIDGKLGAQTQAALRALELKAGLPVTGRLDASTRDRLRLNTPPCARYTLTSNDLARLQPLSSTWLGKSRQSALDYETALELVAEKGHAHPALIRQLNPAIDWSRVSAGISVQLPDAAYPQPETNAAFIIIRLSDKTLEAFDAGSNLLVHFPCSIAQHVEKRPVGELHVAVIAPRPNYTFDPAVFPESAEARQIKTKLILPPGPNNPVGIAWIGLDKPGYGIHGTPNPEQVGRTESHGCFRLANWNAEYLLQLVRLRMPVRVQP